MLSRWANSNSFFGNTFFIFLIRFFPTLANVLVMILLSRQLDTASYGLYQNYWVQVYVLSTVACLGLQGFLLTYNPQVVAGLVRMLQRKGFLFLYTWITLVSVAFAYLQHGKLQLPAIIPFAFLTVYAITTITETVLSVNRRFKLMVVVNVLYTTVFVAMHIAFLKNRYSLEQLFTYILLISGARLVVYLPVAISVVKKQVSEPIGKTMHEVRSLWFHLGLYDMSQMLFRWIDKFIITLFLAEELSAIYFNGSQDIPFLPLLLGAAGSAALMQLANSEKENEDRYIVELLQHSSRILSSIVFPVFFFCVCFRMELFTVVLSERYLPAVPVFLVSVMAIPLRAYSFTTILQNKHKGSIINIGALLDLLLACTLMYPLYLAMGLAGVALGFVISSYLQAAFYLYYSGKLLGVAALSLLPVKNWLIKLIVFAIVFIAVHYTASMVFSAQIVLIWGIVALMAAIAITIALEFKAARNG
jgi:O-antigen/teichoic acid export membrane protein